MADPTDKPAYAFNPGPPPEASRFLRNKLLRPSFHWQDVEPEEHAVAFTVAKATQVDVLETIREEVQRAIDQGIPFAEFQKTLKPRLEKLGWWGKAEMVDPLTGEKVVAQLGSPRRLRTIYRANLRSARAAGQWERIQRTKDALPYLEYRLGPSERHRPHHAAKEGIVLPADDPFWAAWYPPNGWGCKCWVRQLTQRGAEVRGISKSPEVPMHDVRNKRTGEIKRVPVGIDPGWEQNPGQKRLRHLERLTAGKLDAANHATAYVAARDMATSWRAARILKDGGKGWVPVAMLTNDLAAGLGVKTRVVHMSDASASKQLVNHPELDVNDYARFADMLGDARVVRTGERHISLVSRDDDLPWIAVLKSARDGAEVFLVSFYQTSSARYVQRVLKRGEMLRE